MKQILILILAVVANFASASTSPSFATASADKSVTVNFAQWNSKNLTVTIKASNGATIHQENVVNTKSLRKYNLSAMDNGDYTISIEDGSKIANQTIHINDLVTVDATTTEIFKPAVQMKGDKLSVNALLLGQPSKLSIFDNQGNQLYEESIENTNAFGKSFDFSKVAKGDYFITIKTSGQEFSYPVVK